MLIKNVVLKMPWQAEGFFETKKDGFIAAVEIYETEKFSCPVLFKRGIACMIWDDDAEAPATRDEIQKVLKEIVKEDPEADMEEYFPDNYIEVSNGVEFESAVADFYGFSEEQQQDVLNRIADLDNLYVRTDEKMLMG